MCLCFSGFRVSFSNKSIHMYIQTLRPLYLSILTCVFIHMVSKLLASSTLPTFFREACHRRTALGKGQKFPAAVADGSLLLK